MLRVGKYFVPFDVMDRLKASTVAEGNIVRWWVRPPITNWKEIVAPLLDDVDPTDFPSFGIALPQGDDIRPI